MTTNFLTECVFPGVGDMLTFVIMTMAIAAPLAFILSYRDKKAEEARADARAFEGWADVLALVGGLDDDGDDGEDVLTWRQLTHNAIDTSFDKAEVAAEAAKAGFSLVGKSLGYVAVASGLLAGAGIVLAVSATTMWIAFPFILAYVAGLKTISAARAVKAKVSEAKAKAGAAAEKAEAEAKAEFKREAEEAGFLHRDEVEALIADAIAKHESKKHRWKVNAAFERKLRPTGQDLQQILADYGTEEFKVHACQVVLKSIEEMSKEELREELSCGKKYNLRTLRAKVRAARANS